MVFHLKKVEEYVYNYHVGLYLRTWTTTERKLCDNQSHSFHLLCVNCTTFGSINTCGADIGVPQNICQSAEVMLQRIVGAGKQMT